MSFNWSSLPKLPSSGSKISFSQLLQLVDPNNDDYKVMFNNQNITHAVSETAGSDYNENRFLQITKIYNEVINLYSTSSVVSYNVPEYGGENVGYNKFETLSILIDARHTSYTAVVDGSTYYAPTNRSYFSPQLIFPILREPIIYYDDNITSFVSGKITRDVGMHLCQSLELAPRTDSSNKLSLYHKLSFSFWIKRKRLNLTDLPPDTTIDERNYYTVLLSFANKEDNYWTPYRAIMFDLYIYDNGLDKNQLLLTCYKSVKSTDNSFENNDPKNFYERLTSTDTVKDTILIQDNFVNDPATWKHVTFLFHLTQTNPPTIQMLFKINNNICTLSLEEGDNNIFQGTSTNDWSTLVFNNILTTHYGSYSEDIDISSMLKNKGAYVYYIGKSGIPEFNDTMYVSSIYIWSWPKLLDGAESDDIQLQRIFKNVNKAHCGAYEHPVNRMFLSSNGVRRLLNKFSLSNAVQPRIKFSDLYDKKFNFDNDLIGEYTPLSQYDLSHYYFENPQEYTITSSADISLNSIFNAFTIKQGHYKIIIEEGLDYRGTISLGNTPFNNSFITIINRGSLYGKAAYDGWSGGHVAFNTGIESIDWSPFILMPENPGLSGQNFKLDFGANVYFNFFNDGGNIYKGADSKTGAPARRLYDNNGFIIQTNERTYPTSAKIHEDTSDWAYKALYFLGKLVSYAHTPKWRMQKFYLYDAAIDGFAGYPVSPPSNITIYVVKRSYWKRYNLVESTAFLNFGIEVYTNPNADYTADPNHNPVYIQTESSWRTVSVNDTHYYNQAHVSFSELGIDWDFIPFLTYPSELQAPSPLNNVQTIGEINSTGYMNVVDSDTLDNNYINIHGVELSNVS
jgi:hypothetical protein